MNSQASSFAGDDSDEEDEEDKYAHFLHVQRPVPPEECPNPIKWWLDHQIKYPNLSRMALDYLIIPSALIFLLLGEQMRYLIAHGHF